MAKKTKLNLGEKLSSLKNSTLLLYAVLFVMSTLLCGTLVRFVITETAKNSASTTQESIEKIKREIEEAEKLLEKETEEQERRKAETEYQEEKKKEKKKEEKKKEEKKKEEKKKENMSAPGHHTAT